MTWPTFPKPTPAKKRPNRTVSKARAARRRQSEQVKQDVYALVDARDHGRCRACGLARYTAAAAQHHHHIRFRSQGGSHTTANIVSLCADCHELVHARKMWIHGDANDTLEIIKTTTESWRSPCLS